MRQYEELCIKIIPKDLTPLSGTRLGAVSGWTQTQPCASGGAIFFFWIHYCWEQRDQKPSSPSILLSANKLINAMLLETVL